MPSPEQQFSFIPVGFPESPNINLGFSFNGIEGQLAQRIKPSMFTRDLPAISDEETIALVKKLTIQPLKEMSDVKFGSRWNQITAIRASRSLGIPDHKVVACLSLKNHKGMDLRQRQSFIAERIERDLIEQVRLRLDDLKPQVAGILFVRQRIACFLSVLSKIPDLPKSRKQEFAVRATSTMIDFINKFGQQTFDRAELSRKIVAALTTEQPIQIINIQCPPFRHTAHGIEVLPTAEDQVITAVGGGKVILSQFDVWREIMKTQTIFSSNGVPVELVTALVDIDEFVMGDQHSQVRNFSTSFALLTGCQDIRLVSEVTGVTNLESPSTANLWQQWHDNVAKTSRWAMKLLDEEFNRLQQTSLPSKMKTRQFATHMAGRRFVVHFLIGSKFSRQFPQGIFMLRAQGNEASDIDRMGTKSSSEKIFIINHWRERKKVI